MFEPSRKLDSTPCFQAALVALFSWAACGDDHRDAAYNDAKADPLFEEASAQLTQIRPRTTVDPATADATALDAETSWWPVSATATFRTTPAGVDLTVEVRECRKPYAYPVVLYAEADCSALERGTLPLVSVRTRSPARRPPRQTAPAPSYARAARVRGH